MKRSYLTACCAWLVTGLLCYPQFGFSAASHDGNRWFQIEVSIFSHEDIRGRGQELWSPEDLQFGSLARARKLDHLLQFLRVDDFDRRVNGELDSLLDVNQRYPNRVTDLNTAGEETVPIENRPDIFQHDNDLKFFDFAADAFLQLPDSESQFQQTNRSIQRSADHRLLFHGLWRQPVLAPADATPVFVDGGRQYGQHREFQGTLTIRFNRNQDRVVIDADLLLAEFGEVEAAVDENDADLSALQWTLPEVPASLRDRPEDYRNSESSAPALSRAQPMPSTDNRDINITRVYQLKQSRDMRSGEFHYLDHPALGVVVFVTPYDLPLPEIELRPLDELNSLEAQEELITDPALRQSLPGSLR